MSLGTLDFREGTWIVDAKPHVAMRFKDVFKGVRFAQRPPFLVQDREDRAPDLAWFMSRFPLDVSAPAAERLASGLAAHSARQRDLEELRRPDYQASLITGFRPNERARPHQTRAAEMLRATGRLLLLDEVGLGKTVSALAAISDGWGLPAAVVVQSHLSDQWVTEYIERFTHLRAYAVKDRKVRTLPPADVYVFRYSNIAAWSNYAETLGCRTVILDEIQELRHGRGTDKGLGAERFCAAAENRLGLTATPIYNYGSEIFSVVEFIAPGMLGTWDEFVVNWCTSNGTHWIVKDPEALGAYLEGEGVTLRRTADDAEVALGLPPLGKVVLEVGWNEGDAETDRDLQRRLAQRVLSGHFVAAGTAARELDMLVRQETGVAKARSVAAYVRTLVEAGEPVLLGGWHRECFGPGTRILMADGTSKAVENVVIGDAVMGPDSTPRNVLSLVDGTGDLFRVVPNRGEPWVCSGGHILTLRPAEGADRSPVKMTARQFATLPARARRSFVLYRSCEVSFPERPPVVEPWLLGFWLGDGNSDLTSIVVSTGDEEVVGEIHRIAERHGLHVRETKCSRSDAASFFGLSSGGAAGGWGRNPILNAFKALGLRRNKHVPDAAKLSAVRDRLELLAGLIDSDGHVYGGNGAGSAEFVNTNAALAGDVAFVARSLGFSATIRQESRVGAADAFRVTISGDLARIPMRIARKAGTARAGQKNVLHVGFDVERIEPGRFFGFEVDGDHLFLLEDFTVVHNCYRIWNECLADLNPVMFTGSESAVQKRRAKAAIVSGDSKLMIMSLRSGAGVDGLQHHIAHAVIGELDWSPQVHRQFVGRLWRDGQTRPVTAHYLHVDGGSDPVILPTLGLKASQSHGILNPYGGQAEATPIDDTRIRQLAKRVLYGDQEEGQV